jgi:hypothetical protein
MSSITVNDNSHVLTTIGIIFEILDGFYFSINQPIHSLKMRRVRQNGKTKLVAFGSSNITSHAQMVLSYIIYFDISRASPGFFVKGSQIRLSFFDLGKDFSQGLLEYQTQCVKAASMGHTKY